MVLDELDVLDEGAEIRPAGKVLSLNHQTIEPVMGLDERVDFPADPLEIRSLQLALGGYDGDTSIS